MSAGTGESSPEWHRPGRDGLRQMPATGGPALRWPPASGKFRVLAGALLVVFALYGGATLAVAVARGWPGGFGDSFALWSWGRFLLGHPAAAIYDFGGLRAAQLALGMDPHAAYPFAYPPSYLPLLWLLGKLSGPLSLALLMAATLPLYLWASLGRGWRPAALIALLAAPTTAIEIVAGQSGFVAAALLAGGLRLADERPAAAGILFGLLTYKPQLGLLLPAALVAARQWRAVAAAVLTALAIVPLTSALFGTAVWPGWAAAMPAFSREFAAEGSEKLHLMPTVLAALLQLGAPPLLAQIIQWTTAALCAAAVWAVFRRGWSRLGAAALLVGALLATPYAFVYDMPVLTTAIVWLVAETARRGAAFGTGEVAVMMLAMISPATLVSGASRFPLAAVSLVLLFAAIVWRCRHSPPEAPGSRQ